MGRHPLITQGSASGDRGVSRRADVGGIRGGEVGGDSRPLTPTLSRHREREKSASVSAVAAECEGEGRADFPHPPSLRPMPSRRTVTSLWRFATQGCFIPSSTPSGTSYGTPRIVDVIGATVTRER
jgi:hypothetical protein